jgi:hypothetical protein
MLQMDTTTRVFPSETVNSTSNKETEMLQISSGERKGAEDSACSKNGDHSKRTQQGPDVIIKIVSANVGPCEGSRLPTGEMSGEALKIKWSFGIESFHCSKTIIGCCGFMTMACLCGQMSCCNLRLG